MISRDLSEQQKEKFYTKAVNETFDYALNNNYTMYDLESVSRNLQDLGTVTERMANFASGEFFKLAYSLTGENKFEYVGKTDILINSLAIQLISQFPCYSFVRNVFIKA